MKCIHEKQALEVFRRVQVIDLAIPNARLFSGCIGRGTSPQALTIGKQEVFDDRPGLISGCSSADGSEQTNGAGHGMGKPLACAGNFVEEPSLPKGRGRGAGRRAFDEILGSLREGVTPGAGRRAIDEMLGSLREHSNGKDAGGRGPDEMLGTVRESSLHSGKRESTGFSLANPKVDAAFGQNASNNSSALVEKKGATGELLQCSGKEHLPSIRLQVSEKIGMAGRGRGTCLVICEGPNSAILHNRSPLPEINSSVNLASLDNYSGFEVDCDNSLIAESNHKLESLGINKEEDYARLCSGEVDVLCESEVFLDGGTYTSNECQSFGVPQKTGTGAERPSPGKAGGVSDGRQGRGLVSENRQANTSRGQPSISEKHFRFLGKPDHNVSTPFSAIEGATGELLESGDREPLRGLKLRVSQKIGMLGRGRGKSLVACEGQTPMQLLETADSINAPNPNDYFTRQGLDSDTPLVAESNHQRNNWDYYPSGEDDAFNESDGLVGGEICLNKTDDMCQTLGVPLQSSGNSSREVKLESQEVSDDRLGLVRPTRGFANEQVDLGRKQPSVPQNHDNARDGWPESSLTKCSGGHDLNEMLENSSAGGRSGNSESSLPDAKVDGGVKSSIEYPRQPMKLGLSEKIGMLGRGRGRGKFNHTS